MTLAELRDKAHSLPRQPGVYLMQDKQNTVIYVGKAKALKNRVSQYFQESANHTPKTRAMVGQVHTFDVIVVGTEFEALVLECALIKRHQPKYNILLKDSKGYPYIRVSVLEGYPKFSLTSQVAQDKARYFGPYGSRHNTQGILDALKGALGLPQCNRKFPRDIGKERPCLNLHMGRCLGHCRHQLGKEAHDQGIAQALSLLEGKFQEVLADLEHQMEEAAEALRFEQAGELRDRLRAIQLLGKRQKVVASTLADTDVVGFYRGATKAALVILHYMEGELAEKDTEIFPSPLEEDGEVVSSLLRECYSQRSTLPKHILLPCEIEDQVSLTRLFSEQVGYRVELITPQRGAKMELIRLAETNAQEEVERITTKEERENKKLELLGKILGIPAPVRIESYDISNTGASNIVASMVVFQDGRPKKSDYRKFKLNDMKGPDDYASMHQVLTRRFQRYLAGDEAFGAFPSLLLIDGGQEHVNVAAKVLRELKLSVPAFGMVKDARHRTRALITPLGEEIGIAQHQSIFSFIGQIQEETHRVAITYHRQLQGKGVQKSLLDDIPGVGEARRTALLKGFRNIQAIAQATPEQLAEFVPKSTAQAVYLHFQSKQQPDGAPSDPKEPTT